MGGESKGIKVATQAKGTACYLYAITDSDPIADLGPVGLNEKPVYLIGNNHFGAVVSDLPNERLRPVRRHLAAHNEVLKQLLKEGRTVLPMAFGLLADGPKAITKMLNAYREPLGKHLKRLSDKVEMGLHVSWDVPNIFEYFIRKHPDLRTQRDLLFQRGRDPNQDAKIELGRQFERLLAADRAEILAKILSTLKARVAESKENPPRGDKEAVNLAFLVPRGGQKEFEQGIFDVASQFDHHYAFDFSGPWSPHNFVNLSIDF